MIPTLKSDRAARALLLLAWPLAWACGQDDFFPADNANWETISVADAGADAELLAEAVEFAGSSNTNAFVILRHGKLLVEAYWNGWSRDTRGPSFSAAKSVVSVLIGQAIEQGHIEGIDQPAADFLSEWAGDAERQNILIRHHLAMTTGFEVSPNTLLLLQQARNERRFGTLQAIQYPPGANWDYNDAAYRLLFYILEEATGESLPDFSRHALFAPIGMNNTEWIIKEEQVLGQTIENYQWLDFTALDAARFGLLAMNGGNWNGTQIVSTDWLSESIQPQSSIANWYGRLWWLNGVPYHKVPGSDTVRSGSFAPDAPPDTFAALGAFDQKIYVIPSLDLVVARLGREADSSELAVGVFDNLLLGRVCRAFGYMGQREELALLISRDSDQLQLEHPTWKGRRYSLLQSTDLVGWDEVDDHSDLLGDGGVRNIVRPLAPDLYYRLRSRFDSLP